MTRCHTMRHSRVHARRSRVHARRHVHGHRGHVRLRPGHQGRRLRPFRPAGVLLLVLTALIVLGGPVTTILAVLLGVPMLLLLLARGVVVALAVTVRAGYRRRWPGDGFGAGRSVPGFRSVPLPRTPPDARAAPDPRARWREAGRRFDELRGEYAAYECDPLAVLRQPALADVTVPATARFVDAFAEAQALHLDTHTDRDAELPSPEYVESYARAVDRAGRTWRAARDAAERIRLAGLSEQERNTVARVIKLLTMAEQTGHDAERLSAYAKAREELAQLERAGHLQLPRPAAAALDTAARGRLPA